VILDAAHDVTELFRSAMHAPLVPAARRRTGEPVDASGVEALLPHRGSFRLIDRITHVDRNAATIACAYDLERAAVFVEGHFPGRPVLPGVLQVEAVGQAGLCLLRLLEDARADLADGDFMLTHIIGARFVRPVTPFGELEIVARIVPDGLFHTVIGQCLQDGAISSLAAVRGIHRENQI
jgi:3-hydroxymyristoyl/3-hydroxydecanoyl-(acyl carrier protein) dehydratase